MNEKKMVMKCCAPTCFFCKKPKENELILTSVPEGYDDYELLVDYEECDECHEKFDRNIVLLEVDKLPTDEGQPPIKDELFPTGRFTIVLAKNSSVLHEGQRFLLPIEDYEDVRRELLSKGDIHE